MQTAAQNFPDDSMIGTTPECKSWVASRFTLVEDCGVYKRRCRFADCDKEYSRGTSHMILKRHWSKAHGDTFSLSPRSRALAGNSPSSQSTPKAPTIRKKKSPLAVSNSCPTSGGTKSKLPNSNTNSPSKRSFSDKTHEFDVKQVAKRLREVTSLHITFDIYTPKKGGKTFGIITAHPCSEAMNYRSVLLEYKHLPYPDDSSSVYEFLRSCITRFNCREKIISIATNSSDVVASAVQEFDKRYRLSKNFNFSTVHIKCFPQFVHQNVIEVLRSQESLLFSIRKIVGFINNNNFTMRPVHSTNADQTSDGTSASVGGDVNATGQQDQSANETADTKNSQGLKLPIDHKSSWNTTFIMIDTFLQQRQFIDPTLSYFQNTQDLNNVIIDWERLYALVQLLKPFYDIIDKFATDNYTPVSLIAAIIPHLMDHLSNSSYTYEDLALVVHQFKLNLDAYRQSFQSDLTVIGGLLDPRIKDKFTSHEGRADVINILRKRLGEQLPVEPHWPDRTIFANVFVERNVDEVLEYLERPREHGLINVFAYWEAHKKCLPTLYRLARILSCVQATSVPSDRMFSAAEHAEREKKMQSESTNNKELLRSWAKYLK